MTPQHEAAIRSSWADIAPRVHDVAARFHARLIAIDSEARLLLAGTDPDSHRRALAHTLESLAGALDDPKRLMAVLVPLARRHAGYGMREEQIAHAGEALVGALRQTLGERFNAELEEAWWELVELLGAVMRRAVKA